MAGKAVEAARDKVGLLWRAAGDSIPDVITRFGDEVRKKMFNGGLPEGMGHVLDENEVVMNSEAKLAARGLTSVQVMTALLGAERVVEEHRNWRRRFP